MKKPIHGKTPTQVSPMLSTTDGNLIFLVTFDFCVTRLSLSLIKLNNYKH